MEEHTSRADWIGRALARHEASLLRYAERFLRNPDQARDVVQETFLHLCKAERSKVDDHLAAWLFRVCRNRALDLKRKETRVQPLEQETEQSLQSPGPDPHAVAEHREGAGRVLQIVSTLPESQQEAIYLRFQGGLSYKEISEVTGNSVSNVGVLIHSGVAKVRQQLARAQQSKAQTLATGRTR